MRTRNCGSMRKMMTMCLAALPAVIGLGATSASALTVPTVIPVADPSFETAAANDVATAQSPNWAVTPAGLNGVFDPGNGQFAGTSGNGVQGVLPDGGQVGLVEDSGLFNLSTLSQKLGVQAKPGTRYDLSVFVGDRVDSREVDYSVQLLAGGSPITTWFNPAIPANGAFQGTTMSVVAGETVAGELEIRFAAREGLFPSNTQVFFDSVGLTATEGARAIAVQDPSFELAIVSDGLTGPSPLWSSTPAGFFNVYDPAAGHNTFLGTGGDNGNAQGVIPTGGQIGLVEASTTLFQTLGEDAIPGAEYTLSFYVGDRLTGQDTNYLVELLAGNEAILSATNPLTPAAGRFELVNLTGIAPADATGALMIRFTSLGTGAQTFFDDVSLSVVESIVPEPASLTLLGLAALAIGRRRRMHAI